MSRFLCLSVICALSILTGHAVLLVAEEQGETEAKVNSLIATPFTGTPEEYPEYVMRLGDEILALVEPGFSVPVYSPERKTWLTNTKHYALLLRYGFDEAEYEKKYEEFLEAVQDFALYRAWIDRMYYAAENKLENLDTPEQIKARIELLDRWAPLINKYFVDDKRNSNEQLPSIIVGQNAILDPDGSLGLVRATIEKLRPVLEADAKRRKGDLLQFCAQESLNILTFFDMPGKPLEYTPNDLDQKPFDIKSLKGKAVLIVPAPHQEETLAPMRKLHAGLKKHGFEMVLHCTDNLEVAKQKFQGQGEQWLVVSRYGKSGKERIDYVEQFGSFWFALIVDRDGIVQNVWSQGNSADFYEKLKPLFPEHTELIDEVVAELRAIDEVQKQENAKRMAEYVAKTNEKLPASLEKLIAFQELLRRRNTPDEIRLSLTNLILTSDDLPQEKRQAILRDKVGILANLAQKAAEKDPKTPPELAFAEVDKLVDELLKTAPPSWYHNLLFAKDRARYHMRNYLKTLESGHAEYAEKITKRFVEVSKLAPESYFSNSSMGAMFYRGDLEEIDAKYATQLAQSFLEQIIPVFAAKGLEYQQEAKHLEAILKRLSMTGKELEFECMLMNGDKINVKDLRGKVVVVNFWATWCGPCRREFPNMKTQYEKYKDRGYEMIAYSTDDTVEVVTEFQKKNDYPWLVGSQVKSKEAGLTDYHKFYGVQGIPMTFILDRDGKVRFMMTGSDDEIFNRELEKLFEKVESERDASD